MNESHRIIAPTKYICVNEIKVISFFSGKKENPFCRCTGRDKHKSVTKQIKQKIKKKRSINPDYRIRHTHTHTNHTTEYAKETSTKMSPMIYTIYGFAIFFFVFWCGKWLLHVLAISYG